MSTLFDEYIERLPADMKIMETSKEKTKEPKFPTPTKDSVLSEESTRLVNEIVEYFSTQEPMTLTKLNREIISKEDFLKLATAWLHKRGIREHFIPCVLEKLKNYMWGYYVLEDLLNDDDISDIKVLAPDNVQVKRLGKREDGNVSFKDVEDYKRFVHVVATKNQVNISDINAIPTFLDDKNNEKNFLRIDISTEFVNTVPWSYLQIRKTPKIKRTMDELIARGMMDDELAFYLEEKAKTSSILFSGKGGSGKTSLMNAMLEFVDLYAAILLIQENPELFLNRHKNVMSQRVITSAGEGKVEYGLNVLAKNGLLLDLDIYVIGEIKGEEALYFLNACLTGHLAWTSVHGNDCLEALYKLADYIKYSSDYKLEDVLNMLCKAMDVIVYLRDYKVCEVIELDGYDRESKKILFRTVYRRKE